jgi:hypothetical protein
VIADLQSTYNGKTAPEVSDIYENVLKGLEKRFFPLFTHDVFSLVYQYVALERRAGAADCR